jgi:hypothetical protein
MDGSNPTGRDYALNLDDGCVTWPESGIVFCEHEGSLLWRPTQEKAWLPMDVGDCAELDVAHPGLLRRVRTMLDIPEMAYAALSLNGEVICWAQAEEDARDICVLLAITECALLGLDYAQVWSWDDGPKELVGEIRCGQLVLRDHSDG